MKKNIAIKNCHEFTVFYILSANSRKQIQNIAKLFRGKAVKKPYEGFLFKSANRN